MGAIFGGIFGAALELTAADARIRQATIWGSSAPNQTGLAITGSGTAALDPNTLLLQVASPPYGPNIQATHPTLPWLVAAPGGPGGSATASLFGHPTALSALFVGLPGRAHLVLPLPELVWLRPGSETLQAAGIGAINGAYAVPNAPWVVGVTVGWQGVTFDPVAGLQASNPAVYVH